MTDAYARAGVDTGDAADALAGLIGVLRAIDWGSPWPPTASDPR